MKLKLYQLMTSRTLGLHIRLYSMHIRHNNNFDGGAPKLFKLLGYLNEVKDFIFNLRYQKSLELQHYLKFEGKDEPGKLGDEKKEPETESTELRNDTSPPKEKTNPNVTECPDGVAQTAKEIEGNKKEVEQVEESDQPTIRVSERDKPLHVTNPEGVNVESSNSTDSNTSSERKSSNGLVVDDVSEEKPVNDNKKVETTDESSQSNILDNTLNKPPSPPNNGTTILAADNNPSGGRGSDSGGGGGGNPNASWWKWIKAFAASVFGYYGMSKYENQKELEALDDELKACAQNMTLGNIKADEKAKNAIFFPKSQEILPKIFENDIHPIHYDKVLKDLKSFGIPEDFNSFVKLVDFVFLTVGVKMFGLPKPKDYLLKKYGSEALVDVLYVTNASAQQILYKHNSKKARELVINGQSLIENHLKSLEKFDAPTFNELSNRQKLDSLKDVHELSQVYAATMYVLGRTYIYDQDKMRGEKYFKLSKFLSEELGLFEAVLSDRSGLCLIEEEMIKDSLKNGKCLEAKAQILSIINRYSSLRNEETEYIKGFRSHSTEKIKPSTDAFNQIECAQQLLKYYGKLIAISKNTEEKKEYLNAVNELLFGDLTRSDGLLYFLSDLVVWASSSNAHKSPLLKTLDNLESVDPRKIASIYNTLGDFLIILKDTGIEHKTLQTNIEKELKFGQVNFDNGELIYKIFEAAQTPDRSFVKADSYNGLMVVCERFSHLNDCDIGRFKHARDTINAELDRNINYEEQENSPCFILGDS